MTILWILEHTKSCNFQSSSLLLQRCPSYSVLKCYNSGWYCCSGKNMPQLHNFAEEGNIAITCDLKACSSAWSSAIFSSYLTTWLCVSCLRRNSSSNWKEKEKTVNISNADNGNYCRELNSYSKRFRNNIHEDLNLDSTKTFVCFCCSFCRLRISGN